VDEIGAFLGASYFRLLARASLTARRARLALDCGEPDRPEDSHLHRLVAGQAAKGRQGTDLVRHSDSVRCAARMNSTSAPANDGGGRGRRTLLPATDTVLAVNPASKPLKTIGLVPLTSMFWFGKNSERKFDDYRPEVHDNDGLLMRMKGGEILWRPLDDPPVMRHQIFHAPDVRGFGLLQRERSFAAYQDIFNPINSCRACGSSRTAIGATEIAPRRMSTATKAWTTSSHLGSAGQTRAIAPYRFGYTIRWQSGGADLKLSENRVVATRVGLDSHFQTPGNLSLILRAETGCRDGNEPPLAIANCSTNAAIVDNLVLRNPFLNAGASS